MRYGYYPGCSLECNAAAYDDSVRAVARAAGHQARRARRLELLRGHRVLRASAGPRAYALIARNLALVEPQLAGNGGGRRLVAPCRACYLNLKKTEH